MSLPAQSISSFDDIEAMFMTMYEPPIAYHTLLTQFIQIHLKKGERIRDFNLRFFKIPNKNPQNQRPNNPVILECYENAMSTNVKYAIRATQIEDLDGAISKATKMEEIMRDECQP